MRPTAPRRTRSRRASAPAGARSELAAARAELETLYAALDNVDSGLLVLNAELRAVYSNPSLHRLFKSHTTGEIRKTKPFYAELLQGAAAASAVDLDDYVARRLAWVRSADATSMDLPMADGGVLRCH